MRFFLGLALLAAAVSPAQALVIDLFSNAPSEEVARLQAVEPLSLAFQTDASALGGERDIQVGAFGPGVAITTTAPGELDLAVLLLGGSNSNTQNITTLTYDGIDGSNGLALDQSFDLTDNGLSDQFLVFGTYDRGNALNAAGTGIPSSLRVAVNLFGDTISQTSSAFDILTLDFSPGDSFVLSLDFADFMGDPVDLMDVSALSVTLDHLAATGGLRIQTICTGTAGDCVDSVQDDPDLTPVPGPAAWPLFLLGGMMVVGRRARIARLSVIAANHR